MIQIDLYDFFPKEEDPLYQFISKIPLGGSVKIGDCIVRLNHYNVFEIESEEIHVGKESLLECYRFLRDNIEVDHI